eukprot:gene13381-13508_t
MAACKQSPASVKPQQGCRSYRKTNSLTAVARDVKLPASLFNALAEQQQRDLQEAEELQRVALEQEKLQAPQSSLPQSAAASRQQHQAMTGEVAAACKLLGHQQHVPQSGSQPLLAAPVLAVHRLHLGQAVKVVACGGKHTIAALAGSGLMAWGLNDKGQCGAPAGLCLKVTQPLRIHCFDGQRLVSVAAGGRHSVAVQENGMLVTWGHGKYGRLGIGGSPDILPPSVLGALRGCPAVQAACGSAHTLALMADGRVFAWGYNGQGALGTGDTEDRLLPTVVPGLPPCVQIAAAAASMALSHAGQTKATPTAITSACSGAASPSEECSSGGGCFYDCKEDDDRQRQSAAAATDPSGFDPDREPVVAVSCGEGHQVLLCQPTLHTPSTDEVRVAIIEVLRAYVLSYLGSPIHSLNALMQQASRQRDTDANWDGGSGAASTMSKRRSRQAVVPSGNSSSVINRTQQSGRGSTTGRGSITGRTGSVASEPQGSGFAEDSMGLLLPVSIAKGRGESLRGSRTGCAAVSFAADDAVFGGIPDAAACAASSRDNSGCGSVHGAAQPGSVHAASATPSKSGQKAASIAGGASNARDGDAIITDADMVEELGLHGVMLLCRELGLIDNITEHTDVMRSFATILHRKTGRLGPAGDHSPPQAAAVWSSSAAAASAGSSQAQRSVHQQAPEQQHGSPIVKVAGQLAAVTCSSSSMASAAAAAEFPEAAKLKVVYVIRPGVPAADADLECVAANASPVAAALSVGRTSSTGPISRGGSPGPGGMGPASSNWVLHICSLNVMEILELLLLIMRERHPRYRRQPEVLVRLLAGWHVARLQARRPDKGPPWLLRQVLQPEILTAVESPATTSMLHGIYVYLAGSSNNPQNLSMNLSDLQMGLKHAAGFRSLQDAANSPGNGRGQPEADHQLSNAAGHGMVSGSFDASTHNSRSVPAAAGCGGDAFHVPLRKVAAFLRQANLLPRLLQKYMQHQQRLGEQQKGAPHAQQGALILPSLQVTGQMSQAWGFGTNTAASSCRRRGGSGGGILLPPVGLKRGGAGDHRQDLMLSASGAAGDLQNAGSTSNTLPALVSNKRCAQPRNLAAPVGVAPTDAQQEMQQQQPVHLKGGPSRARYAQDTITACEGGMIDAFLLDSAELVPMQAKTSSIVIASGPQQPAAKNNSRTHAAKLVLQLPAPHTLLVCKSTSNSHSTELPGKAPTLGGSSSVAPSAGISGPGTLALEQLGRIKSKDKQGQGKKVMDAAQAPTYAANQAAGQVTYQQQQEALKQQKQAQAADARQARELETIRQDTWTVFMLVELLGSHLVTPQWEAAVKVPPAAQPQHAHQTDSNLLPRDEQATAVDEREAAATYCSWQHGYRYTTCTATINSAAGPAWLVKKGGGVSSMSSASGQRGSWSGVRANLLDHRISYPQFIEVLLCVMAARATSLLEPDVKQLQALALDEEMQDHVKTVLERIRKWQALQLAPWTQRSASRPAQAAADAGGSSLSKQSPWAGSDGNAASAALDGIQPICRLYGLYSSMKIGQSVLGLCKANFIKLLWEAAIIGGDSEVTPAAAASLFRGLVGGEVPAGEAAPKGQLSVAVSCEVEGPTFDFYQHLDGAAGGVGTARGTDAAGQGCKQPDIKGAVAAAGGKATAVLTLRQLYQALTILSRQCFPRIANATRAWQLMLEKHIRPLADRHTNRYDAYLASLTTPGVVALMTAWDQQLEQLYETALAVHRSSCSQVQQQLPCQARYDKVSSDDVLPSKVDDGLSLVRFLELLQDHDVIPRLLEPGDVQEVLKRLLCREASLDEMFKSLTSRMFREALGMCALAAFDTRLLQGSHLHHPEQQLGAFFTHLGLPPLPGQQLELPSGYIASNSQLMTGSTTRGLQRKPAADPYQEWWSLQFDPAADSRPHDHLSSLSYMPALLQEIVAPPPACPAEVLPMLQAAATQHQQRNVGDALQLYKQAEGAWGDCLRRQQQQQQHQLQQPCQRWMPLDDHSGRDAEAWQALQQCEHLLLQGQLHEAGADAAVWHAAAGAAFEQCVRAYVIRCECASLGPCHPDTAGAAHNLGVVLDCLGKSSRALELVDSATKVFAASLGPSHPRTVVAAQTGQHIKHKIVKLPAHPEVLMEHAMAAGYTGSICETGLTGLTKCKQRRTGQGQRSQTGCGTIRERWSSAKRSRAPAADGSGRMSSRSSSTDDTDEDGGATSSRCCSGSRGMKQLQGQAAHTSDSQASTAGSCAHSSSGQKLVSQERLQAVSSRRKQLSEDMSARHACSPGNSTQPQTTLEFREYTHLDHLGAGVFKASLEQRQLFEAVRLDVEAHARAAASQHLSSGVLEVQILPTRQFAAGGMGQFQSHPVAAAESRDPVSAAGPRVAAPSSVGSLPLPSSAGDHCCTVMAALPAAHAAAAGTAHEVRRGALGDATIAALTKFVTAEEARKKRLQGTGGNVAAGLVKSGGQQVRCNLKYTANDLLHQLYP